MSDVIDWQSEEKDLQVSATQRHLEDIDRTIVVRQRELRIAQAAYDEFQAEVQALTNQQFDLRRLAPVQYTDADGFEQWGAPPEAQRQYDQLREAIKRREGEYQRWVDERRIAANNGPIDISWSPRNPISVQRCLGALGREREGVAKYLRELQGIPEREIPRAVLEERAAEIRRRVGVPTRHRAPQFRLRASGAGAS